MIAPAKLNLCLYLGPTRPDGLHELCSLFAPLALADQLTVAPAERDEVVCAGVHGPELGARALEALRGAGWRGEPQRIEIDKRIPLAAGLGGGSADAAAVLRLAAGRVEGLELIAAGLGADVPSQLDPRFALVGGAGERVTPLPEPARFAALLIPDPAGLSTAAVYAEADRLGLGRERTELERLGGEVVAAALPGRSPLDYAELLINDLGVAAISLRPAIAAALADLRDAGAEVAIVTGSGPTAVGLFRDLAGAEAARERLAPAHPGAIATAAGRIG